MFGVFDLCVCLWVSTCFRLVPQTTTANLDLGLSTKMIMGHMRSCEASL